MSPSSLGGGKNYLTTGDTTMATYKKKGFLHQHFRIFHLKDTAMKEIPFHYHDSIKSLFL